MYPVSAAFVRERLEEMDANAVEQKRRGLLVRDRASKSGRPNPPHGAPGHNCHDDHFEEVIDWYTKCLALLDTLRTSLLRGKTDDDTVLCSLDMIQFLHGLGPTNIVSGPTFPDPAAAPAPKSPAKGWRKT
jgi:hypothetical protein